MSGSSTSAATPPGSSAPETATTHHRFDKTPEAPPPHTHRHSPHPPGVPAVDMPRPSLTPGAAFHVGRQTICKPGYSARVRDVPESEATAVYRRYHTAHIAYAHEVDHLVSLEIGGSNAITNLWPEPYAGRWGARTKDILENKLHDLVCAGRLGLKKAQHQEAANWVAAYRLYVSRSLPKAPRHGGRPSTHRAADANREAPAASGLPPTGQQTPSTAPTTPSGTSSARPISATSRPTRRRARHYRGTTSISPAELMRAENVATPRQRGGGCPLRPLLQRSDRGQTQTRDSLGKLCQTVVTPRRISSLIEN